MAANRSPGSKLLITIVIGLMLSVPLAMVYALVWDRQQQSETAQASIAAGWGGPQTLVGPVLVLPYEREDVETTTVDRRAQTRTIKTRQELFLSPVDNRLTTRVVPQRLRKSIYESVLYDAENSGTARFALPEDFARYGVALEAIDFARAELRFGLADARGLQANASVTINGVARPLLPGKGLAATRGSGFFTFVDWSGRGPMTVVYRYAARGNGRLSFVPRGQNSEWSVHSEWSSPSFAGAFLPNSRSVTGEGFRARYAISNLALGQAIVLDSDPAPLALDNPGYDRSMSSRVEPAAEGGASQGASISLVEPVDLYSQVNRSVKYGFLFIGFTFLAFLMFDVVGGARVATAEYLLVGAALVLFFVLLLAFAEVIGFTPAYLVAAAGIVGLLTTYSAAVLKSWKRSRVIGGLLLGLYAALYVLLNLEAYSLLIGSLLLFIALAVVMWATRKIDWGRVGEDGGDESPA